ncbi:MAG: tetratricopeptide repeat protein [Chitinophagaceae bacterium]
MRKQQIILVGSGVLLVFLLFIFGRTVPSTQAGPKPVSNASETGQFSIDSSIRDAKARLSPSQQVYVNALEISVVRGDVKNQQLHVYHQLATFWKDSVNSFYPYAFYTAEASKLENSEKSLNFAARLFLDNLRGVSDPASKGWMANQAKELFERSLQINPLNDSAKIGLGSSYFFGSYADDPQQVMKGIQQILEVTRRDSANMYAQLMLGIGGVISGQLDKAIERLLRVIANQPENLEAMLTLAEAYERQGDKANAVKWYETSKRLISHPEVIQELDQRIKSLE